MILLRRRDRRGRTEDRRDLGYSAQPPAGRSLQRIALSPSRCGHEGELLPLEHGFSVRMVIEDLDGDVSVTTWVIEFTVTTFAYDLATGQRAAE